MSHFFTFLLPLILATAPTDVRLLVRDGDQAYNSFQTREAITYYEDAYRLDQKNFEVLSRLARSWADLGRLTLRRSDSSEVYYRRALTYAQQLVAAHPDSASSWFMLALCHGSLTPFKSLTEKLAIAQDVEKNAQRSLRIDSTYSMTYVLLGIYYRGVSRLSWMERLIVNGILGRDIYGTIDDSYRSLQKALELDPDNSFAHYELSWTLRAMDRPEESEAELRKVLTYTPTNERERLQKEDAERRLARLEVVAE